MDSTANSGTKGIEREGLVSKDNEIKDLGNGGFIIIHKTDKSLKQTNKFVNNIIKGLGLVEEGFHLLPE